MESDTFDEVDDTEMQLQNTISHIERLILSSRKVKNLAPSVAATAAAREAGAGPSDSSGGEGDGKSGGAASAESDGDGAAASSRGARARVPPKIDRKALVSRRQSTSFFDTKPVFSARDSSSSFTKMWNGGGSALRALGEEDGKRPLTSRPTHTRRQSERWGWKGEVGTEDVIVGTPPTVEGSAGSTSESPSNG